MAFGSICRRIETLNCLSLLLLQLTLVEMISSSLS
jgi:hypothetical protein